MIEPPIEPPEYFYDYRDETDYSDHYEEED